MAFELKQNLKLTQQLIMTPQLQQAIKLLQLSRLEMVDMINQEMEENPLLEEAPLDDYQEPEKEFDGEENVLLDREEAKPADRTEELTGEGDGKEDFDWNNYLEDYRPVGTIYERRGGETPTWDNILTSKPSLLDHLMWQLKLSRLTDMEMRIGEQIIGNIDSDGYLRATLEEIAAQEGVETGVVEDILRKVQEFDPPGIAARDLRECLLIQVKMLSTANSLAVAIIQEHLHDLERKDYKRIARKLKVHLQDIVQAVELITHMDPKPGSAYTEEKVQSIIPDVYVFKVGDDYKIILNDDGLPNLRISNYYKDIVVGAGDKSACENGKKYLKEKAQSASWLIKSIRQRQKAIYGIAESIVKMQKKFFDSGIDHLKPLVLRDIADDVGMHESTISRVVTNKYMHTPRGVFELKYFFSSSIQTTNGDTVASKSVKEAIKKIIAGEEPKQPLSDEAIVKQLDAMGISIARRTVAKYREMMRILSSSRRKKYF
jgi:RNA polymerase sigma-54 factor